MGQINLPDFQDLMDRVEGIGNLSRECELLDIEIMLREADVIKTVTTNNEYFVAGKVPSMDYIKSTYKLTGLHDEITPMRREKAILEARLEVSRKSLDILKSKIEVWRSIQATERSLT